MILSRRRKGPDLGKEGGRQVSGRSTSETEKTYLRVWFERKAPEPRPELPHHGS